MVVAGGRIVVPAGGQDRALDDEGGEAGPLEGGDGALQTVQRLEVAHRGHVAGGPHRLGHGDAGPLEGRDELPGDAVVAGQGHEGVDVGRGERDAGQAIGALDGPRQQVEELPAPPHALSVPHTTRCRRGRRRRRLRSDIGAVRRTRSAGPSWSGRARARRAMRNGCRSRSTA